MDDRLEKVLADLRELGFTEYEGKVYLALLSNHPASAYTVSQDSGVPHSRVYDITRRLIRKGCAVSLGSNPELFMPLSPDDLIEKLRRDTARITDRVADRLKSMDFQADFDPVWNLRNRDEALDQCTALIEESRLRILIGLWPEELAVLKPALESAHLRGVELFVLLYGEARLDLGTVYHHGVEHMPSMEEPGRTVDAAFDGIAAVSGNLGGGRPGQVIWTRNQGLVSSIEGYIIHDFYLAEIRREFGGIMDEKFGPNLSKLRDKFNPG